jgi:hypothetical protein
VSNKRGEARANYCKEYDKRYQNSPAGITSRKKYTESLKGRVARKKNSLRYYATRREEIIRRVTKWRRDNPNRARAIKRKAQGVKNPTGETKIGPCEICDKISSLVFDHDHNNGKFRGWLCQRCNLTLGTLESIVRRKLTARINKYLNKLIDS